MYVNVLGAIFYYLLTPYVLEFNNASFLLPRNEPFLFYQNLHAVSFILIIMNIEKYF